MAFCNIRDIELPAIMVEENIFVNVKVLLYGSKTQIEEVEFTKHPELLSKIRTVGIDITNR